MHESAPTSEMPRGSELQYVPGQAREKDASSSLQENISHLLCVQDATYGPANGGMFQMQGGKAISVK